MSTDPSPLPLDKTRLWVTFLGSLPVILFAAWIVDAFLNSNAFSRNTVFRGYLLSNFLLGATTFFLFLDDHPQLPRCARYLLYGLILWILSGNMTPQVT
jgi:hypothetical protein